MIHQRARARAHVERRRNRTQNVTLKGDFVGRKAEEALELATIDDLIAYLRETHSAYMQTGAETYYLTDANDIYWRAQDTNQLNEKDHFVDCSELVPTLSEFIDLPFIEGESIRDVFDTSSFYASIKIEGQGTPVPVI